MNVNHAGQPESGRLNTNWGSFDFLPDGAAVKRGPGAIARALTKSNPHAGGLKARAWNLSAPSLRVPATRENRARLRALRAAELAAWQERNPQAALRAETQAALREHRRESLLLTFVAGIGALALILGATTLLDYLAHSDRFTQLVQRLLG